MSCVTALMLLAFVSSHLETILSDMNRADIILSVLTVTCAQCAHFPRVRTRVYYGTDFTAVNILFNFITIVLGFWENDKNDKKLTPNEIILKHNIYLSSTHFSSTADLPSLFSSPICSICPHTSSCADTCTPVSALQRWSFLQISSSCQQTWKLSCSHSPASNLCHSYLWQGLKDFFHPFSGSVAPVPVSCLFFVLARCVDLTLLFCCANYLWRYLWRKLDLD